MTSCDNHHAYLIDSNTSNVLPIIKFKKQRSEVSSTSIPTGFSLISPISPSRNSDEVFDESESQQILTTKRAFVKHSSMAAISRQLSIRKFLQNRLRHISDIMCFLGILGVILMVVENEITFSSIKHRDTNITWFIKLIITISTVILVGLVIYYHYINLNFYATQNSLDGWATGLTVKKIFLITLEILICAIHPVPQYFPSNWMSEHEQVKSNSTISPSYIVVDVALGLPMFARFYLVCRCILFHSHLFRDAPLKSLGSLNKVSINFIFLIKTYLEQWPARCLITLCLLLFLIGSWSLRACDYKPTITEHISMVDSMWLFIITFTTVGYGDLTPSTYCGRSIATITSLVGLLASALLISVVAQKLQLTRWEKYVHNFVLDIELTQQRREQAANVIKFAVKVWYLKRKCNLRSFQYLKAQRMLFKAIYIHRKMKHKQRKLNDNCLDLFELINIQRYSNIKTKRIVREVMTIKFTMSKMEEKFADMNDAMNNIHHVLNLLLEKSVK